MVMAGGGVLRGEETGFQLTSPAFGEGGMIPSEMTCEGANIWPALEIRGEPVAARSLALIVDDPDAPSGTFTHWLVWNVSPHAVAFGAGRDTGAPFLTVATRPADDMHYFEGTNDFGTKGYSGPCPPSGTHRYYFRLLALDRILKLKEGAGRKEVDAAIKGHVIATATLMGRYQKHAQ
jgi:Raf kinase inhibitor-like YbhB/YbcL family protein